MLGAQVGSACVDASIRTSENKGPQLPGVWLERHGGGAARQLKLRAAREGPALHLGAWKRQGQRAASLQGSQLVSHLHSSTAPASLPSIKKPRRGPGSHFLPLT